MDEEVRASNSCIPGPPPAAGLVRSATRARRLRRRLRRGHQGPQVARHRQQALQVLMNLAHRGACGCEVNTGDGAGILIQMPDRFLRKVAPAPLPPAGEYGVGLVFLPRDAAHARRARGAVRSDRRRRGPAAARLARRADRRQPGRAERGRGRADLPADVHRPRRLARRRGERRRRRLRLRAQALRHPEAGRARRRSRCRLPDGARKAFYIVSLSCNTLIYKGMLTAEQIAPMFPDLADPDVESALALVHQRFSTNTFPAWPLAHPYRFVAHNGEINTLTGNINWMRAREGLLESSLFGDDLKKILPIIREGGSDTATFDNVLEFLVMTGRSLPHAILMMIPEPWAGPREHAGRAEGVLRVPLVADGAVGRPGVDRVLRRHGDRRRARPQRPAAVALLRHQGRPGDHGVGGRRARHPGRGHRAQGAAAPGPHLPGRHGARPDRVGRRGEARAGARRSRTASG